MTSAGLLSLYDLTQAQLAEQLAQWGEPAFRVKQIWRWLYQRFIADVDEMTDLPRELRARLKEHFVIGRLQPVAVQRSRDRWTRKWLFRLPDGSEVEAVLMEYDGNRRTACISSQVGCAMACSFCATGQMGFMRNLRAGEIVEQVIWIARTLGQSRLTNIVYMGMGEPFANYQSVMESIKRLTTPASEGGFGIGARKITLSTVGLVPGIRRFAEEPLQINLAVSLHAATDELRSQIVPINTRYPLHELTKATRDYIRKTNRRVSYEWALIERVNDTLEQARALVELVRQTNPRDDANLVHVNLIPLNPTQGYAGHAPNLKRRYAFCSVLERAGIPFTLRVRRGIDIAAGCGQLKAETTRCTDE
ncbi:MAG: 23S rRNA (adenine(2503)-C(2))-methyltransferase RlmN [Anaerolineae bacterium]|nr:23S rRNA (adenine(2503)-C(2))-methyltransferase RlmN [Anaerolineae bacterium]